MRNRREHVLTPDFLPTVLDFAGIPLPGDQYKGKRLHRPTGASLLPHLEEKTPAIHSPTEAIGFEGTGSEALFKGNYKLVRNSLVGPAGWRLINLSDDPVEARDLSASLPEVFKDLQAGFETYVARNGVILPPAGYDGLRQLLRNNWPVLLQQLAGIADRPSAGATCFPRNARQR